MSVTLKGLSVVELPLDNNTSLLALRIAIAGQFNNGAEFKAFIRDIFNNRLEGAVFSVAVRCNMFQMSSTLEYDPRFWLEDFYTDPTPVEYGSSDGWQLNVGIGKQTPASITYVNSVQAQSSALGYLKYKGVNICYLYNGGYSGADQWASAMPVIIFTDDEYNLYTLNTTNKVFAPFGLDVPPNAPWTTTSRPFPTVAFYSREIKIDKLDTYYTDSANSPISLSIHNIADDIGNEVPVGPPGPTPTPGDDPYSGAGDSVVGGGGGDFNYTSDPPGGFGDFSPPSISAADAGFITLYNPTIQELNDLASYLWSSSFDLNTFKKLFNDPMDLFLGLSILPVAIPDGGRQNVGIGLIDTGIQMTKAATQWVAVNCGSVTVNGFSGSYLDYDPYTNIEIYLPYIGVRSLKADEVVGHTLSVNYWVDILSGACVAWLDIDGHLMYTFMGQCATSIPVASGDWTNIINGVLSVIGGAVGGAVKGGVGGAIAGGVSSASAVAVTEGKISVERSGTISSAGGLLSYQKPFLIFSAPRLCKPANQNVFEGYPAYVTMQIGNLSGFTQIELVHISGIYGTDSELDEIKELLLSGVII